MATWPTITDDDGSNTTGTVVNNANAWTPIQTYIGTWTTVSFSAGNFTANGSMTWTVASGDQVGFRYIETGKRMLIVLDVRTSTVGGTPNTTLKLTVPNSRSGVFGTGAFAYLDNGTAGTGWWQANGTVIELYKSLSTPNWSASTDSTYVLGSFEIQIA